MSRRREVALLLVATTVALVLCEVAYRAGTMLLYWVAVARDADPLYRLEPGDPLAYTLRPNGQVSGYAINEQGLRGRSLEPERGPAPRVLALGDSYTFGWGIDDASLTWPGRLESMLGPVEVYDAGVPGYGTVQESHLLDRLLARARVDVVVLAYVMNDAEPQHTVVADPRIRYRGVRSWLLDRLAKAVNVVTGRELLPVHEYVHSFDYRAGFAPGAVKAAESRAAFERIVALARSKGAAVVVAILPDFTEPFDERYPYADIHAEVARWSTSLGVPTVDLLPAFRGRDHTAYSIPGDGHPNAAAHRLIAETIAPAVSTALGR
jgi:lysophospholipase L1-like esterase